MGLQREEVAKRIVEIYELPITWEEYLEQSHAECIRLMKDSNLLPGKKIFNSNLTNLSFFFSSFLFRGAKNKKTKKQKHKKKLKI